MCSSVSAALAYDAQLGWAPVGSAAGYKVYVRQSGQSYGAGTDAGNPVPGGDGHLHYVVFGLQAGVTNFFAVSDYTSGGSESALSNELSLMVTPTPTPTATGTATADTAVPTATTTCTATSTANPAFTATPTAPSTATLARTITATPTSSPVGTVTASGPVAAYAFSEGGGTTTADASGNGHTGTLFGNPQWTAGAYDTGLQFSGGTTYDGVNLAPNNGFAALSQGTLEAWVKFDTSATAGIHDWFDGHDESGCSYPFEFDFNNQGGTVYWEVWAGNTAQCNATFYAQVALANPGQWHHLAYVVGNTGNAWYVDGLAQTPTYLAGSASTTFFFASIAASSNTRYDVGTGAASSERFEGTIDELRIYDRPLTQAEVQADMNVQISESVPTASPTPTPTVNSTAMQTASPTSTATGLNTATPLPTNPATATNTLLPTATATNSPSPSATAMATRTSTATNTSSPSRTATATRSPSRSSTVTATYTASPLPSKTAKRHSPKPRT